MRIDEKTLKNVIMNTVAEHFGYTYEEIEERYEEDEIARMINEEMRQDPEQFGLASFEECDVEFQLNLEDVLPFTDEPITFYFHEDGETLTTSTVLVFDREFVQGRWESVKLFIKRSPLSEFLTMEDDGMCLIIASECDSDTPDAIRDGLSRFLTILTTDNSLYNAVIAFMEM